MTHLALREGAVMQMCTWWCSTPYCQAGAAMPCAYAAPVDNAGLADGCWKVGTGCRNILDTQVAYGMDAWAQAGWALNASE